MKLPNTFFCLSTVTMLASCQSKITTDSNGKTNSSAVATVVAAKSSARPVPDIKDLRLGDSESLLKLKFPKAVCKPSSDGDITSTCQIDDASYGGDSAVIFGEFTTDRLEMIHVYGLEPENFDPIIRAMVTKFGIPDDSQHRPAIAGARDVTWSGEHWLLVTPPSGSHTAVGVTLIDTDFFIKIDKEKNKNITSDL